MRNVFSIIIVGFFACANLRGAEPRRIPSADRVETTDGEVFAGKPVDRKANGDWVFETPATESDSNSVGRKIVLVGDLFRAGVWKAPLGGPRCELRDGGVVRGEPIAWSKQGVELESIDGFDAIRIPPTAIDALVFDPHAWDRLRRESSDSTSTVNAENPTAAALVETSPQIVYVNGDRRRASIVGVRDGKLTIRAGERESTLPFTALAAVVFPQPSESQDQTPARTGTWLGFSDGSSVLAAEIARAGETWSIVTPDGAKLTAERGARGDSTPGRAYDVSQRSCS
ncbi:MAG: hypothetical protein QM811_11215 [Pirellulales bacterium]